MILGRATFKRPKRRNLLLRQVLRSRRRRLSRRLKTPVYRARLEERSFVALPRLAGRRFEVKVLWRRKHL
jgi:hypothetical protein